MPMSDPYLDAMRDAGQALITHVGLVDASGVELSGGGYARQPVAWTDEASSISRLAGDEVFTTEAGDVVAGWRGFSALNGGVNYGGAALPQKTYSNPGTYTLLASLTYIDHNAG